MSAIKDGGLYPITLDKERHLLFSLHIINRVEDEIGDIADLQSKMEEKGRMKFITWLLTLLINEGEVYKKYEETGKIDGAEVLDERIVSLIVNGSNLKDVIEAILKAFSMANRGTTEPPEGSGEHESEGEDEGNTNAGEIE
ncbi:MAG: hypothetical protein FWE91_09845 [Defluviitaleaceae bacterium]|nr:hypothetical protein [Defluviitaleaceae bacterium]